jgi:hypothetical protein
MSISLTFEEAFEKEVNEELKRVLRFLRKKMIRFLKAYSFVALHKVEEFYKISPRFELEIKPFETGLEAYIRFYFDTDDIKKLRDIIANELRQKYTNTQIRLKALKDILVEKLSTPSGEFGALLSDNHSGSSENIDQDGGDREEIWDNKGRATNEGVSAPSRGGFQPSRRARIEEV